VQREEFPGHGDQGFTHTQPGLDAWKFLRGEHKRLVEEIPLAPDVTKAVAALRAYVEARRPTFKSEIEKVKGKVPGIQKGAIK
jgi:hypothetical protein